MKKLLSIVVAALAAQLLAPSNSHAADPTLWIVGDSTVRNGQGEMVGWGEVIGEYFDPQKIKVENKAIGGRSSRTFQNEGRWDSVLKDLKRGDFVFVQFGHNDIGPIDERGKFRGSLKGTGNATEKVTKADGKKEEVHSFGWYMRKYAEDAKAKGAKVVIFSPVPHKDWNGSKLKDDFGDYRKWAEDSAKKTGADYVDLTEIVTKEYNTAGPETVETFFADARTHTSKAGAEKNARCVVAGLKGLPDKPLDRYFSKAADDIQPAN